MLLTPFAVPSWEPRLAVDCQVHNLALLWRIIEIVVLARATYEPEWNEYALDEAVFNLYKAGPSRLVLVGPSSTIQCAMMKWEQWKTGLNADAAAHFIAQWVSEVAVFPPSPWFDGGELQGCQIYSVSPAADGKPEECRNMVVVEPKWFEVHK